MLDVAPGFVPAQRTISLGERVQWVLEAPGVHEVRDATGLSLYASGPRSPVSFVRHTFTAAGTYGYQDPQNGDTGDIGVPVNAPATGTVGEPIHITWATTAPDAGLVFENNGCDTLGEAMAALEEGLAGCFRGQKAALRSSSPKGAKAQGRHPHDA